MRIPHNQMISVLRRLQKLTEETVNPQTAVFQRVATSNVDDAPNKKVPYNVKKVSSRSYDMRRRALQCVARSCELIQKSVSQLRNATH